MTGWEISPTTCAPENTSAMLRVAELERLLEVDGKETVDGALADAADCGGRDEEHEHRVAEERAHRDEILFARSPPAPSCGGGSGG